MEKHLFHPSAFNPLLDLTLFLAYLQGTDVRALHDRWLSPRHVKALGACLAPSESYQAVRSERQAGRITFVHYLCESLGLLCLVRGRLKPAPAARHWLAQVPSVQMRAIWDVWLSPGDENQERWSRYRLPGCRLRMPVEFARRLVDRLTDHRPDRPFAQEDLLASSLDELIPWWEQGEGQTAAMLLPGFLDGPLTWLGVLKRQTPLYCLTPFGAWLLDQSGALPPVDDVYPLTMTADLALHLPAQPRLDGVLALAEWANLNPGPCLRLSPHSIARAWERGGTFPDLLAALGRYAMPRPTPRQCDTLQAWLQELDAVVIQPFLLLRASTSEQMDRLWQQPSLRAHLGRRLAPELAIIKTSTPEELVQALRRRGFAIHTPTPGAIEGLSDPSAPHAPLSTGEAEWLLVSLMVHNHLAWRLDVTSIPPSAIVETLTATLDPSRLAAAQAAAERAITRLEQVLDGPAPTTLPLSPEVLVERLEAAIHAGQGIHLRYWSAARDEITERQVEPHYVEWHGDRAYLVAYCHLRQGERTFRLDRILDATPSLPGRRGSG